MATITGIRGAPMGSGTSLTVELDLLVAVDSNAPIAVTRKVMVQPHYAARIELGRQLRVKVDPANLWTLWIDWSSER